jgi:hypothetical protein
MLDSGSCRKQRLEHMHACRLQSSVVDSYSCSALQVLLDVAVAVL